MRAEIKGSCLCGQIRFATPGPLRPVIACHCTQCGKQRAILWLQPQRCAPVLRLRARRAGMNRLPQRAAGFAPLVAANCFGTEKERIFQFLPAVSTAPRASEWLGIFFVQIKAITMKLMMDCHRPQQKILC